MKYTVKKLVNRILIHKGRLEQMQLKNFPAGILNQEEEIIHTLEAVLAAKQKFLYRCMGITIR